MLLGFISLLLTVFQDRIAKICISKDLANQWLPCQENKELTTTAHFQTLFSTFLPNGSGRRLLAEASDPAAYCTAKVIFYWFSVNDQLSSLIHKLPVYHFVHQNHVKIFFVDKKCKELINLKHVLYSLQIRTILLLCSQHLFCIAPLGLEG